MLILLINSCDIIYLLLGGIGLWIMEKIILLKKKKFI